MKALYFFLFTILLPLCFCSHALSAESSNSQRPEILILHSYSPDYSWTQTEQAGIASVFDPLAATYKLRIEYMDTNHNPEISKGQLLLKLYKDKFSNSHFRAIIVTDNAAFDFLKQNRNMLFPGVPVIFCGINGYEPDMLARQRNITGVAEDNDFGGLFETIERLQPAVTTLVIYGIAEDPTHSTNKHLINKVLASSGTALKIQFREFSDIESCITDAEKLGHDHAVLMIGNMKTRLGEGVNLQRANELMSAAIKIPVYTAWDFGISHGAVGGLVLSGYDQGRLAAEITLRVLRGETADNIEVQRKVSNVHMFDFNQLRRFGLKREQLPRNSIIHNLPENSYKIPRETTWVIGFSFMVLCVVVILLALNISSRKKVEENLKASQEKYAKAFRNSADVIGIARLDDGRYIEVSDVFFRIFGFSREEVINRPSAALDETGHSQDCFKLWLSCEARTELFRKFHEQGFVKNLEVVWCTKAGEQRIGLYSAEIITISGIKSIIYVWHDITDIKQAEIDRIELQERLRHAQKMESIGLLAGGIAHDFNNLLTPILGYAEILLVGLPQDDPRRKPIGQIHNAADRASSLTRQLLAFSRKQRLELKPVNISAVVANFEQILRRTIREDISISTYLMPDPGTVMADVGQLEQVIMNLAVNAQDAMPNGGRLTIETDRTVLDSAYVNLHPEATTGPHVVLIISDSGTGIEKELLDQIFEPFFTTKERGKGTGLGLSTVYGIIKQHEGSISVYSEPERGTTFKIFLKCAPHSTETHETQRHNRLEQLIRGNETILIAEDNELVRNLTVEMLQMSGYRVLSAGSGVECISTFVQHEGKVDLLLTDVIMPGMNGKELARELVRRKPELKVLYMSGYTGNVIDQHGLLDENVQLIQKPLTLKALSEHVRMVLDS